MKKILFALTAIVGLLAAPTLASATDTVGLGLEYKDGYNLKASYTHDWDEGTFAGASVENVFTEDSNHLPVTVNATRFEGLLGQKLDLSIFKVYGLGGLGYEYTGSGNFAYYQGTAGLDVALNDCITWNTVKYRYRDSFDSTVPFKTQRLETGITYGGIKGIQLSAGAFHDWNGDIVINQSTPVEISGIEVGLKHSF